MALSIKEKLDIVAMIVEKILEIQRKLELILTTKAEGVDLTSIQLIALRNNVFTLKDEIQSLINSL